MPSATHDEHGPASPLASLLIVAGGAGWLLVFCLWFFGETLPPDTQRIDLLLVLPEILALNFEPLPDSGWHTLPQRFDLMLTAAVLLAAAWGLGRAALHLLCVDVVARSAEAWALTFGLGLSLWSLLTLGLGLAGFLHLAVFAVAAGGAFILGVFASRRDKHSAVAAGGAASRASRRPLFLTLLVVGPFLLAMTLGSLLPTRDFDVKEYHLEGPKEWFLGGRIEFLPHNVYTSFPFCTEMLSLSAMALRGDWFRGALAGQLVLMIFAILTALGIFALGKRLFGERAGWVGVVVWLTSPWTYRISMIAYAEGGLSCYLLLSVLTLSRGLQATDASLFRRWSLLTGLLAGSAAACKYPAVLTVVIPIGAVLAAAACRRSLRGALPAIALYSAGVLGTFGPWLLKNAVETGNPVYPLLWNVFGGRSFDAATNARWERAHGPPKVLLEQPELILPDLVAHARDVALRSDWQTPLLFGLAPLSLLFVRRHRTALGLWVFVLWLFFTWLWLTHRIDRFWVPMVPVVAVLAGAGGSLLIEHFARWRAATANPFAPYIPAGLALLLVATCLAFNFTFATSIRTGDNAYLLDLDAARVRMMGSSARLLHEARIGPPSRVLFVGEAMVFDATPPYVYNTVFDDSIFEEWFAQPVSGVPAAHLPLRPMDEIRATLEQAGITHLCVNWAEILRYRVPGSYGFTDFVHPRRFNELVTAGLLERTPFVDLREREKINPGEWAEAEQWAPELRVSTPDGPMLRAIEVYRVAR